MKISHHKFLLISIILCACGGINQQDKALLEEAGTIHNEMMATAEAVKEKLEALRKDSAQMIPMDSIMAWKNAIEEWEADLVEVPGNEEPHHGKSKHDHHEKAPDVTAEQMLVVQKELKMQLKDIQQRIKFN